MKLLKRQSLCVALAQDLWAILLCCKDFNSTVQENVQRIKKKKSWEKNEWKKKKEKIN